MVRMSSQHFPYILARHLLGRAMLRVVNLMFGLDVPDTQCGFKACRLSVARYLASRLSIDRFAFDSTTHQGSFESSLRKGTLAVVSGKLAKQSPEAMKVRTPAAVLGVRGTEFLVRTGDPKD